MPLFRVDVQDQGEDFNKIEFRLKFRENKLSGLFFVQPVAFDYEYKSALLQVESLNYNTTAEILDNFVQDAYIQGTPA